MLETSLLSCEGDSYPQHWGEEDGDLGSVCLLSDMAELEPSQH